MNARIEYDLETRQITLYDSDDDRLIYDADDAVELAKVILRLCSVKPKVKETEDYERVAWEKK